MADWNEEARLPARRGARCVGAERDQRKVLSSSSISIVGVVVAGGVSTMAVSSTTCGGDASAV